ncbi:MAG: acylglycerol kinase family protein [Nitrosomonas sp.]|nr:MAG: acylglycerol kinase family protein [Nitrosomonas sp.]
MALMNRIERLAAGTAKVGCLFNPMSGGVRKRVAAIRQELAGIRDLSVYEASDVIGFKAAVDQLIQADVDLLLIVAGDGTTHAILGHLFMGLTQDRWPLIMIVPGGTTNMTPLDLGMRGKPEQLIRRLQRFLRTPTQPPVLVRRPVLRIEQNGSPPIFGMFFAVGLVARGVKFSRSSVKQIGITGGLFAALIMLRSLLGMVTGMILGREQGEWAPVTMTMTDDDSGRTYRGTYLFAQVSALDCLLLNIRPYWGTEPAPLHVTLVDQQRKRLWHAIWPMISGNGRALQEKDGYFSHNTHGLMLQMDDEYIVDGELYRSYGTQRSLRITATDPVHFLVL